MSCRKEEAAMSSLWKLVLTDLEEEAQNALSGGYPLQQSSGSTTLPPPPPQELLLPPISSSQWRQMMDKMIDSGDWVQHIKNDEQQQQQQEQEPKQAAGKRTVDAVDASVVSPPAKHSSVGDGGTAVAVAVAASSSTSVVSSASAAAPVSRFAQTCTTLRGPVAAEVMLRCLAALQQQRCQLVRDAEALRGQANDAVMRGVHALVQTVLAATPLCSVHAHSALVTMLCHLGEAVNTAFGETTSAQIATAADAVLDKSACRRTVFALLFNKSSVVDLRRFAQTAMLGAGTKLDVLFDVAGDASARVPFEVATYAGVVDASHLPVSKLIRETIGAVSEALVAANPTWLRALRGQP